MHDLPLPDSENDVSLDDHYARTADACGPDRIHALADLGAALLDLGDDDGAFAAFAASLDTADNEVCPHHRPLVDILAEVSELDGYDRADRLWDLAVRACTWGLDDLALAAYQAADDVFAEYAAGLDERAWCAYGEAGLLAKRGDTDEAAGRYRDAAWWFQLTGEWHQAGDAWSWLANLTEETIADGSDADPLDVLVTLARAEDAYLAVDDQTCAAQVRVRQTRYLIESGASAAAADLLQSTLPLIPDDERPYGEVIRARALSELRLFEDAVDAATAAIEGLHALGDEELEGKVRRMRWRIQRRADQDRRRGASTMRTRTPRKGGRS